MTLPAINLAIPLIKRFEGCRLWPYRDAVGIWTIGWGSTLDERGIPVTGNTSQWTQAQADADLLARVVDLSARVDMMLPEGATDGQRAALYSFVYNLGLGRLMKSKLLALFCAGDVAGAAAEFDRWNMAGGKVLPGLVARRAAEKALFLGDAVDIGNPITVQNQRDSADALNAKELARVEAASPPAVDSV